ncbi:hypothetical protein JD969_15825 [Planctomycetota bacterium]|nr:hypothetical protein JD969_15825 [Planctomycetota bacterium]
MNAFVFSDDAHYWWKLKKTSISMACCDWNFTPKPKDPPFTVYDIITSEPYEVTSAWGLSHGSARHHLSKHISNIAPAMINGKHDNLSMRIVADEIKPDHHWQRSLGSFIEKNDRLPANMPLSGELTFNGKSICAVVIVLDENTVNLYTCTDFTINEGMRFIFKCRGIDGNTQNTLIITSTDNITNNSNHTYWITSQDDYFVK